MHSDLQKDPNSISGGVEISIVIPLFDEAQSLEQLANNIFDALEDRSIEVIFVDDGSRDTSWEEIKRLRRTFPWIHGLRLQRNYGKSTALQSGFEIAQGRYVVTMDADLQDDPAEIPEMVVMLKGGADLVSGWKRERHDPLTKTVPSRFFNAVTRWVTGIHLHDFNCGLKAYRREVLEQIYLHGELHRYVPLLASWEGFTDIQEKEVRHRPRKHGKTKFGINRFMHGFLDLVTIMFVNHYMNRPMHFFGTIGFLSLLGGGLINLYMAYIKIFNNASLSDRPLLYLGIMLVVIGVQFFSIGFLGDMINRNQVRKRKPNVRDRI